jgi:hypothetical protein
VRRYTPPHWPRTCDQRACEQHAGIARFDDALVSPAKPWEIRQTEIDINFSGPVHLTTLFTPHLLKQSEAAILYVSSLVAFTPFFGAAVYSATKAALHSYVISTRYQLALTKIQVIEVAPPMVATPINGMQGHPVDVYAKDQFEKIKLGHYEIAYKVSRARIAGQRAAGGASAQQSDTGGPRWRSSRRVSTTPRAAFPCTHRILIHHCASCHRTLSTVDVCSSLPSLSLFLHTQESEAARHYNRSESDAAIIKLNVD